MTETNKILKSVMDDLQIVIIAYTAEPAEQITISRTNEEFFYQDYLLATFSNNILYLYNRHPVIEYILGKKEEEYTRVTPINLLKWVSELRYFGDLDLTDLSYRSPVSLIVQRVLQAIPREIPWKRRSSVITALNNFAFSVLRKGGAGIIRTAIVCKGPTQIVRQ